MIQFFFDLSFDAVLQIFLPTIYLNDKHSKPGYVDKKGTVAVLESNEFDTEHAPLFLKKLLQIYDELQPKEIYKRFELIFTEEFVNSFFVEFLSVFEPD